MTRRALTASAAVIAVAIAIGAVAQTPPPERQGSGQRQPPRYVDDADYDPQPYFVDGVEYKPYVPERKPQQVNPGSKPSNAITAPPRPAGQANQAPSQSNTVARPAAASAPPVQPAPGELRPYTPTPSQQASMSSSSSSASRAAYSASSSTSKAAYTPKKRPRYGSAVIEVLDKVTAESMRFEAPIGKALHHKGLIYIVRACETTADDEAQYDVMAFIQIRTATDQAQTGTLLQKPKEVFRGWSFASSPSLNPMQHPNYDAWVVGCRNPLPA